MEKDKYIFYFPYWEQLVAPLSRCHAYWGQHLWQWFIYTLLKDLTKSKENLKARKVLKEMGIRWELWPNDNLRKIHLCKCIFLDSELSTIKNQM